MKTMPAAIPPKTGCPDCDTEGPALGRTDPNDLHRALHDLWRGIADALEPAVAWLAKKLS